MKLFARQFIIVARILRLFLVLASLGTISTRVTALSSSAPPTTTTRNAVQKLVSGDGVAWNTLVGEADRAFRLGIQLEKNGQARKASTAFHEAATLYQCFLDGSEFGHVTSLNKEEGAAILAYACLSLGYLNLDALKNPKAAARLYTLASKIDPVPTAVSFDGIGQSLEAAGAPTEEAVEAYRKALALQTDNRKVQFHLAVALDRMKHSDDDEYAIESNELLEQLRRQEALHSCLVDSWGYVRWHTRKSKDEKTLNLYRGTRDMLEIAFEAAAPVMDEAGACVCEFGVGSGRTLRMCQEILPLSTTIHGFDTFTGLPHAWGAEPVGTYSTGGIVPSMEGKVCFHKGLFRDTIGPFLEEAGPDAFLAYANIDCRLYSSTVDILEAMHGRVRPGTILVFAEYICHASWRQDEFRAWRECCKRFGWKYEYLAFSLSTSQAVVRVTDA